MKATDNETIIQRMKLLMELSKNNNNAYEAELAAGKLQDMLTKHNMEIAQVEASNVKNGLVTQVTREKRTVFGFVRAEWQKRLMNALAGNNFCMTWVNEEWRDDPNGRKCWGAFEYNCPSEKANDKGRVVGVHIVLGREDNVIATELMYEYLLETMYKRMNMDGRTLEAEYFLEGCVEILVNRLYALRKKKEAEIKEREKEASARGECGLILLSDLYSNEDDLNADFRNGWTPGTTVRRRAEYQARDREIQRKIDELVAQGISQNDAWYLAHGYSVPVRNPETPAKKERPESPSARRIREKSEASRARRSKKKQDKEREKERRKYDSSAYRNGREVGHEIGLDPQVEEGKASRMIS
jgi:hypothetical protein